MRFEATATGAHSSNELIIQQLEELLKNECNVLTKVNFDSSKETSTSNTLFTNLNESKSTSTSTSLEIIATSSVCPTVSTSTVSSMYVFKYNVDK